VSAKRQFSRALNQCLPEFGNEIHTFLQSYFNLLYIYYRCWTGLYFFAKNRLVFVISLFHAGVYCDAVKEEAGLRFTVVSARTNRFRSDRSDSLAGKLRHIGLLLNDL
jgi:hypothetical protein